MSLSSTPDASTIVLHPNLLPGIDYYLVNISVWGYLSSLYGYDFSLVLSNRIHSNANIRSSYKSDYQTDDEFFANGKPILQPSLSNPAICKMDGPSHRSSILMLPADKPTVPDPFANMASCSLSVVYPCVVCGADSVIRCKQCNRCYYCSLQCYSLHSPYHHSECARASSSPTLPLAGAPAITATANLTREGIVNTGNTCYLASSLQCLFSVAPLRRLLVSDQYLRYLSPTVHPATSPHA